LFIDKNQFRMYCFNRIVDSASPQWRFVNNVSVTNSAEFSGGCGLFSARAMCGQAAAFPSIAFLMISKQVLKRVVLVSFLLSLWLISQPMGLADDGGGTLYWDNNFLGGPGGPWDTTSSLWSTNSGGVPPGLQTTWVQGDSAVFSASDLGTTNSFNVTLSQNVVVANLTYTGGSPGSQLSLSVVGEMQSSCKICR
jgi:hypothetical protein